MSGGHDKPHIVVIGAGFTGLSAAYEAARLGIQVTVLEKNDEVGGLASAFKLNGQRLERFYHHWFINDEHLIRFVTDLGCEDRIICQTTKTGVYFQGKFFKLSTPFDLLRFRPLSLWNRIRLGLLVLRVRQVKDWKRLESMTAKEWLLKVCGRRVYDIVWEPLIRGKFGPFASEVSAVWFWNKVLLRGGSRSKTGKEMLAYYRGGFAALADEIVHRIESAGGRVMTGTSAKSLIIRNRCVEDIETTNGVINATAVVMTPALPIIAELLEPFVSKEYTAKLRRIKYLANMCLVLELSESLSDIYWLNVNDPDFPFIGVVEHTNFQPAQTYGGKHIVYLSKYLPETNELYHMTREQIFEFSLMYLKQMFPKFERSWINRYHVWKARYAQPIVERNYSQLIPSTQTPIKGLYIATMAQIYPEDRGTNYGIREGRRIGQMIARQMTPNKDKRGKKDLS